MASNPSSQSKRVGESIISKAVNALLYWHSVKTKARKPQLLDEDNFIYLVVTLKRIPAQVPTNPHKVPLPHPLHTPSTSELCLFIDDRPKSKLTSKAAKKKVQAEGIPVSKVIKLSKLKSDYCEFEKKRKLCNSYDMFLTDNRVVHFLPKLLGKQFFKKKKIPVPIDLTRKNWKDQIDRVCGSALLFLRTGTCSVIKVGRLSMDNDGIVENVVAAINGVAESVPRKWGNVRSCHLKLSDSLALPLYQVLPDLKLKIEGMKRTDDGMEDDVGNQDKKEEKFGDSGKSSVKKGLIREVRYMDLATMVDHNDDVCDNDGHNDDVCDNDGHNDVIKGSGLNDTVNCVPSKRKVGKKSMKKVGKTKIKKKKENEEEYGGILGRKEKSDVGKLKKKRTIAKSARRST